MPNYKITYNDGTSCVKHYKSRVDLEAAESDVSEFRITHGITIPKTDNRYNTDDSKYFYDPSTSRGWDRYK